MYFVKKVIFKVNKETLAGNVIGKDAIINPQFLFLHGAGPSVSKITLKNLALKLADLKIKSFSIDFSGHGESTGTLIESSLKKRVEEASAALKYLDNNKPITICAFSMSGYVALKLLEDHAIENLVLIAPALYAKDAYSVSFDQRFTDIIRQPSSWKQTDLIHNLKDFKGNLLILIGERDKIIPKEVIEMIYDNAISTKSKKLVILPDTNHYIAKQTSENDLFAEKIANTIDSFLKDKL